MASFKWSGFQVFVDHMHICKVISKICWDVEASWASQASISPTRSLESFFFPNQRPVLARLEQVVTFILKMVVLFWVQDISRFHLALDTKHS